MGLVSTLKHEVKEFGLVTLYFFFCFGIILTLKKLMLATYAIEFYALSGGCNRCAYRRESGGCAG